MFTPRMFFFGAGLFMLLDGIGYSVGALIPIQKALAPKDAYLKRRLALNLLLANQGLYFAALAALLGAYFADTHREASNGIETLCLLTCIYTMVTVPLFTPRDWPHIIPRALAATFIIMGWGLI